MKSRVTAAMPLRRDLAHDATTRPLPCSIQPPMLDDMEKTISMSQLAKNAERIAADIETAGTVYRIKRPGHRSMVLLDDQYLERWRATFEFMAQHPNWEQELADAEQEYRAGQFVSLDDVLRRLGLEERPAKTKRRKATRRVTTDRRAKRR